MFSPSAGFADLPVEVPCGQCIGCRLERSRQWAMRCMHEASLYDSNVFLTLTYDDYHLPSDLSLKVDDFQRFMKRLRKARDGQRIRFFHCGEYGAIHRRPHYHALIFNCDFPDKETADMVGSAHPLYISSELMTLWPLGNSWIGSVTFDSAAYVARYCVDKVTGEKAEEVNPVTGLRHYELYDSTTGEIYELKPEYVTMSRRPGIGKDWFKKFGSDCYPKDEIHVNGQAMRPPKFYDTQFELQDARALELIKRKRIQAAGKFKQDQTRERLDVREAVASAKLRTFSQRKVE